MQYKQLSTFSILAILISCTCGRPRLEPLTACEEAIYSCCSSPKSTFLQSARCFELNSCPGINFIENPCLFLSSVLNRMWPNLECNTICVLKIKGISKYILFDCSSLIFEKFALQRSLFLRWNKGLSFSRCKTSSVCQPWYSESFCKLLGWDGSVFRCTSISWFQVVTQWVILFLQLAHLRVFQIYLFTF